MKEREIEGEREGRREGKSGREKEGGREERKGEKGRSQSFTWLNLVISTFLVQLLFLLCFQPAPKLERERGVGEEGREEERGRDLVCHSVTLAKRTRVL